MTKAPSASDLASITQRLTLESTTNGPEATTPYPTVNDMRPSVSSQPSSSAVPSQSQSLRGVSEHAHRELQHQQDPQISAGMQYHGGALTAQAIQQHQHQAHQMQPSQHQPQAHSQAPYQQQPYPHQPMAMGGPFLTQQQQHMPANAFMSPSTASPGSLASSATRSPITGLQAMDVSPFDTFRATPPDAYAPMYNLPPSSTPQSPTFSPLHTQQMSDSNMYMYGYNAMPAILTGMIARPPMVPPGAQSQQGSATPFMMAGVPSLYGAQSPILMPTGLAGMDRNARRDSHLSQGAVPYSGPPQFGNSPWGSMSSSGALSQGYMHGHSPSWSSGDPRGGHGAHRRIVSGPYSPASLSFMQPGSPTGFVRPPPGRPMHSRTSSTMSFGSSYGRLAQSDVSSRSPLLEEFRARHNRGRRYELADIRGSVVEFSSDQHGSRFAQEKLNTATEEELQMVFDEILPHARTLTTDVFGNYVVQKLIEHGSAEMRFQIVAQMTDHILPLSLSTYGCRVVQRALDFADGPNKLRMAAELHDHILQCVRDQNANHVVQKILERVTPSTQVDFIPNAFRGNVYNLAAHCYSCRVLQRIFEHCNDEQKRPLLEELLLDGERLMHDQYGNYVIQWVLRNGAHAEKDRVIQFAKGNVLRMSCHKFASNVVEQIIVASNRKDRIELTEEIVQVVPDPPKAPSAGQAGETNVAAAIMMRDQYGNYVLQRFLEHAEGQQKQRLIAVLKPALISMKRFSGSYTKHLAAIERLLDGNVTRAVTTATMDRNGGHTTDSRSTTAQPLTDSN